MIKALRFLFPNWMINRDCEGSIIFEKALKNNRRIDLSFSLKIFKFSFEKKRSNFIDYIDIEMPFLSIFYIFASRI